MRLYIIIMAENRISIQKYAMHFGTYMGVFWMVKFIFFPLGFSNSFLMFLFFGLTMTVPFLGYYFARSFRDRYCGGSIHFVQAWVFMIFMYLFASLLAAVAHFIYFRYIDNGYIIDTYVAMIENAKSVPGFTEMMEQYQLEDAINTIRTLRPIEIVMQLLSNNMLFCSILALITAPFVAKKRTNVS